MSHLTIRLLNLRPRGRHAADPLAHHLPPSPYPPFDGAADETQMLTAPAVAGNLAERRALTAQRDVPTAVIPALNIDVSWPPAPPRGSWLPYAEASALLPGIRYPEPAGAPEAYAAAMAHASLVTATSSPYEDPRAWPRPALPAGTGTPAWVTDAELTIAGRPGGDTEARAAA
jgi:hypothetical protein